MPTLILQSNVKIDNVKEFSLEFAKFSAELLAKPLNYISTSYTYNESLTFAGTFGPAFILTIYSLGNINPQENVVYSKGLFEFMQKKLGVPDDRGYIVFDDPGKSNMGYKGTTFGVIWKD